MKSITTISIFALAFFFACSSEPNPRTPDLDSMRIANEEAICKKDLADAVFKNDNIIKAIYMAGYAKQIDTFFLMCDSLPCNVCKEYYTKLVDKTLGN